MSKSQQRLFDGLRSRSIGIHRRIRDGIKYGVEQFENTITQTTLLELARRVPGTLVRPTNAYEESLSGADWEWWIEGESSWFGALVQAKRLKNQYWNSPYDLGYKVGGSSSGTLQADLLVATARSRGVTPLYVLYNGPRVELPGQWKCGELPRRIDVFGASFLHGEVVKRLEALGQQSQSTIRGYDMPLACLACPGRGAGCRRNRGIGSGPSQPGLPRLLGFSDGTSTSDLAFSAAISSYLSLLTLRLGQFRRSPDLLAQTANEISDSVRAEPPGYVQRAMVDHDSQVGQEFDENAPRFLVVSRGQ